MPQIPVGVQLYTLRDEMSTDFLGTLRKVADIGFAGVEFAGFGGLSAREIKAALDDLNLRPAGAHVGLDGLQDLPAVIDFHLEIGNRYIVMPWATADGAAGWRELAKTLDGIGQDLKRHGIQLCYHNHAHELAPVDGVTPLDLIFATADAENLQAELDLYWVKKGGVDPVAYLNCYAGRVPLVHFKDMAADADGSFAEVGTGILDWPTIARAAQAAGAEWFIVEQDVCTRPALESVAISLTNLKAMGLA
jgi:sugar phosphate isomerase/epimerase